MAEQTDVTFDLKQGVSVLVAAKINKNQEAADKAMENLLASAHNFLSADKSVEELEKILAH